MLHRTLPEKIMDAQRTVSEELPRQDPKRPHVTLFRVSDARIVSSQDTRVRAWFKYYNVQVTDSICTKCK